MAHIIVKQPNSLYCVFSTYSDNVVAWNLDREGLIDFQMEYEHDKVFDRVDLRLAEIAGKRPRHLTPLSYEEMLELVQEVHGEAGMQSKRAEMESPGTPYPYSNAFELYLGKISLLNLLLGSEGEHEALDQIREEMDSLYPRLTAEQQALAKTAAAAIQKYYSYDLQHLGFASEEERRQDLQQSAELTSLPENGVEESHGE